MMRIENHCCSCAAPGYPCRGSACELRHVKVFYCDECAPKYREPLEEVFEVDGKDLCEDCLKKKFIKEI